MPAPVVEIDDVTTILDEVAVLHRLRLRIPAGLVTVLMGPSGVGKTTLIKHVVGLLEPDGGTVRIGSTDMWDISPKERQELRKQIGAMLGGSSLYSTSIFGSKTVLGNLTYTLEQVDVPEEERAERAMSVLRELRLDELRDQLPEDLPAHARKRLALARALVVDGPLTVLDEIDVGLDHQHSRAMLHAVHHLHERTGCTLLITTHNLDVARHLADQLAIMVNGRIVAVGPPEELLDGIRGSDDFDRRYEFSDYKGPPRLEEAEAAADRRRPEQKHTTFGLNVDPQMVWIAIIAVIVIVVLFVVLKFVPGAHIM
jgi:phospholipid/cholesterol/gamma-HCH transport system ATP-binding protein